MTKRPEVIILGAGPAGVAAAHALTKAGKAQVRVLERAAQPGGNSSSFQIEGIWCDYGSHRFHPVADPKVIEDVKGLLGDDLLLQPRHGRIRLGGRGTCRSRSRRFLGRRARRPEKACQDCSSNDGRDGRQDDVHAGESRGEEGRADQVCAA